MEQGSRPRILVFASGSADGGGSGFVKLVEMARRGYLQADIVAVVSNHENGGVRKKADKLGIPFEFFDYSAITAGLTRDSKEWKQALVLAYQALYRKYGSPWVMLSGWLKPAYGLVTQKTVNIHPGPVPQFGGFGMHGHHVHEAVLKAFGAGQITHSAVSMHFVDDRLPYDQGPLIFMMPVPLEKGDTADTIAKRVNAMEHAWQWYVTNLIVQRMIRLENGEVVVPPWYTLNRIIEQGVQ